MKSLLWCDISTHNGPDDCWIVVDGAVYDVTDWIKDHPGGDILATLAGEDASAMFHCCHLHDIAPMLERFKIGIVKNYKPDFEIFNDVFMITLRRRVHEFFTDNDIDYRTTKANRKSIFLTSLILVACWMLMYLLPPWGFLASVPMGLMTCSLIGSFGHERIHSNLADRAKKKGLTYHVKNDILWGLFIPFMPERFFQYEHIKHHLYPMSPQHDYDVFALKNLVRLSPELKAIGFQSLQHIYAPLIYGSYVFLQILGGYTSSFFSARDLLKDKGVLPSIIAASMIALMFHIAIPVYLTNVWWVMLCASTYFFTWQAAIYITSGVPHMTDVEPIFQKPNSWALYVCNTTKNLKCGSWIYGWLTGGLNHHLVHHLLPSIPREHLPKISHIVEQACKEYGYPYFTYTSFSAYYRDHYRFLYKLGHSIDPIQTVKVSVRGGFGNLNSRSSGFSAQCGHDLPNNEERKDEQTTAPEPFTRIQGQSGPGGRQGGAHAG